MIDQVARDSVTDSRRVVAGHRSGKTLLEALVIITMLGVVLTGVTTTLVTSFRVERQLSRDTAQEASLARLASRVRTDAHAAIGAKIDSGCELMLADGRTVRYAFESPRIVREVRRGDAILHRDAFLLPAKAEVAFSAASEADGQLVRVSITPADQPVQAFATPVRSASIEAAVASHRQHPGMEAAP
jgi:type II secretory pathway pseudopilin PulG